MHNGRREERAERVRGRGGSSATRLGGILPILVTPFDEDLRLDEESYRSQVEFCIVGGARGLVSTAVFGEFFTLSDDERKRAIRIVVDQAAGRVPVIAATAGVSIPHAVELTEDACEAGADAIMAMPPYVGQFPRSGVKGYYQALSNASTGPVILQNAAAPMGSPVLPSDVAAVVAGVERVEYVKDEVPPNPRSLEATVRALGGQARGVFGGFGGLYMLTEYRRGATGWMPAPEFLEVMVGIYELLEAGEEGAARELHARLLPAVVYEHLLGVAWAKRALVRRGVIRTATTRTPTDGLDFEDEHELDIVLSNLSDLLVTPGPLAANASQDRLDGREA